MSCFLSLCFFTYFVSCNGPCAPKEKWHRKEHIIIFTIIIFIVYSAEGEKFKIQWSPKHHYFFLFFFFFVKEKKKVYSSEMKGGGILNLIYMKKSNGVQW